MKVLHFTSHKTFSLILHLVFYFQKDFLTNTMTHFKINLLSFERCPSPLKDFRVKGWKNFRVFRIWQVVLSSLNKNGGLRLKKC